MSKVKATVSPDAVASTLSGMAAQIGSPVLNKTERRQLRNRNEMVPDQLVEMIIHLADQNDGQILGMSFDAATARTTLAQTSAAQTQINVARQLLLRMEDDMIQQRATVADPSFAIFSALRRLVKTKSGNSLTPAYDQMKAIVKNRPRRTRAKKTTEPATTTTAPKATAVTTAASQSSSEAPTTPVVVASTAATPVVAASTSN
jgi:hypothetical protein